ncbi:hypothetical protein AC578_8898 [Pseudocercospora eumusae]|uniref:Uncharacterized protein n=1 Tax=Pseudocercospora eumusae TaxID=321146 RepID=A0A139HBL2_9PEZI|nr:hypothetical protein AC578_8898 [Pseudocercospora eumusae]
MYRHPILVVSGPERNSHQIDFLLMTTLGSNRTQRMISIAEHASQARIPPSAQISEIAQHLPVEPSPRHPGSGILLKHKYGMKPESFGNVAFRGVYFMDWRDAQLYWDRKEDLKGRIWELDDVSIQQVLTVARRECQYIPPVQAAISEAEELMVWRYAHPQQARMYDQWQRFLRTFGPAVKLWYLMWPLLAAAVAPGLLPLAYCVLMVVEHFLKFYRGRSWDSQSFRSGLRGMGVQLPMVFVIILFRCAPWRRSWRP